METNRGVHPDLCVTCTHPYYEHIDQDGVCGHYEPLAGVSGPGAPRFWYCGCVALVLPRGEE